MARKAFLLRIDSAVLAEMQAWAERELRSLNGQIEFVLRQALAKRGVKVKDEKDEEEEHADEEVEGSAHESRSSPSKND